jgi:hypothetical protein
VSPPPPARPGPAPVRRAPRVSRVAEGGSGSGFLSQLRQRERSLDELVDVSPAEEQRAEASEPDIVDVVWKDTD